MDLALGPSEEEFRRRLLDWLSSVAVPAGLRDYGATPTAGDIGAAKAWQRRLFDGGWAGLSWPRTYGGAEATLVEQAIFAEELARAGLPRQLNLVGLELAGPMVIAFGTEGQRERFLPPTLRGERVWCQLFSEPGAGSDLASLQTRAVACRDGWRIQGQKVWTSGAHYADYGLLLARSDPSAAPHRGITCFVLPMDRTGIAVRPIHQMDGEDKFNEVFLDDVPVGPEDLLGAPGEGWRVAVSTLGRERLTLGAQAIGFQEVLRRQWESVVRQGRDGEGPLRQSYASLWSRSRLLRLSWLRALGGPKEGVEAQMSLLKLSSSELSQAVSGFASQAVGCALVAGEGAAGHRRRLLSAAGATIAGGTSEIQRNIIAERVLGLPRAP